MTRGQTSSRLKYGKQSIQAIIIQPLVCFISCCYARNGTPYDNPYAERPGFHELIKLWCTVCACSREGLSKEPSFFTFWLLPRV